MSDQNEIESALAAGRELGTLSDVRTVGGVPFLLVPEGYGVESLEAFLSAPLRVKQTLKFPDVAGFVAYVNRFKTPESTIFADQAGSCLTCILDYHGAQPAHTSHRATLTLKLSDEWNAWVSRNEKAMGQDAFAMFLEDRLREIVEPNAARVLHVAEHFEAKKTAVYRKAIRRDNGTVQFEYSEEADGTGKGDITVPTELVLGLRVYEHQERGEAYRVNAKLRWGLNSDKLSFTLKLDKPAEVQKAAFADVLKAVGEATGIVPLIGSLA